MCGHAFARPHIRICVGLRCRASRCSRRLGRFKGPPQSRLLALWGEEEQGSEWSFRHRRKRNGADFATTLSRLAPSATGDKPCDCVQIRPGLRPTRLRSSAPVLSPCSRVLGRFFLLRLAPSATGDKPCDCVQIRPGLRPTRLRSSAPLRSYLPAPGCSDAS